jgi:membrane protease YdiL (CAAX protease family)
VQARPGWYADPWRQAPWRWWDGAAWSAHVWPAPPGASLPWATPPWATPSWAGVSSPGAPWAGSSSSGAPPADFRRAFRPTVLWALAAMAVAIVAGLVPTVFLVGVGADDNTTLAALTVVVYPVMFGGFYLTARRISRTHGSGDLRQDFGWRRFHGSDIGWGVLGGFAAMVLQIVIGLVVPQPDDGSYRDAVFGEEPNLLVVAAMALPVILGAPIFEELLFRGPVQRSLIGRFGGAPGLVLQGVVFSLYHVVGSVSLELVQAWYLVPLFAVGVLFGVVKERTGRLAAAQIAHGVMNLIAYSALVATTL